MSSETSSRLDLDDIVPLSELRPSRKHFGPINSGKPPRSRSPQKQHRALGAASARKALPAAGKSSAAKALPRSGETRSGETGARSKNRREAARALPAKSSLSSENSPRRSSRNLPAPAGESRRSRTNRRSDSTKPARVRHTSLVTTDAFLDRYGSGSGPLKPTRGWRAALLKASGGLLNVGPSAADRRELAIRTSLRRPVTDGTVAVFSRKGGVGKTTITAYLGLTLASQRGGRIIALDGDAEAGSLGWLLAPEAGSTLSELVAADPFPADHASLRQYTYETPEGLEVIVCDPAEVGQVDSRQLATVARSLGQSYDVSLFDTGAGVTKSTGRVLINSARTLLLVMGPSVDSVRAAERTLAWLDSRPGEVASSAASIIAVINGVPAKAKESHIRRIEAHFADRCSAVVRIPWDAHLAAGNSPVSLEYLAEPTQKAFLELAATTVATLSRSARRRDSAGVRRAS